MNAIHNGYEVTDEQQLCIDQSFKGSQKVDACAGSGKTSTLSAISSALNQYSGLYVAFNKSIQVEATSKMPSNVSARTAHSLAYRAKAIEYQQAGKLSKCYPTIIAQSMGIQALPPLTAVGTAGVALETVSKYCYSADTEISNKHVNMREFKVAGFQDSDIKAMRQVILSYARKLWGKMINTRDPMPITHDVYLKLWALDRPYIQSDFILFDEAQDANPVLTDVILSQNHANLIFVGDRYQQIYSWRGTENAMQSVNLPMYKLTKSFRFGQAVADVANHILNKQVNAGVDIKGFEQIESTISRRDDYDCMISRTNASMIGNVFAGLDSGKRVHVNGGTQQLTSLIKGIQQLHEGRRTNHTDLRVFETYEQLQEYAETEQGKEIKVPLDLIEKYTYGDLINALETADRTTSRDADFTLTTAHKSKGLEWNNVKLDADFRPMLDENGKENKRWSPEEANLLYVASTRAMGNLDCSYVDDIEHLCEESDKEVA